MQKRKELLRINPVLKMTGIGGRTTLYRLVAEGKFPPPIKLSEGGRSSAWVVDEVQQWIDERIKDSRAES